MDYCNHSHAQSETWQNFTKLKVTWCISQVTLHDTYGEREAEEKNVNDEGSVERFRRRPGQLDEANTNQERKANEQAKYTSTAALLYPGL